MEHIMKLPHQYVGSIVSKGLPVPRDIVDRYRKAIDKECPILIAEVVSALRDAGLMEMEVAALIGRSARYVKILSTIHEAEPELKDLVKDSVVSPSVLYRIIEECKANSAEPLLIVQQAILFAGLTEARTVTWPIKTKQPKAQFPQRPVSNLVATLMTSLQPQLTAARDIHQEQTVTIDAKSAQVLRSALEAISSATLQRQRRA